MKVEFRVRGVKSLNAKIKQLQNTIRGNVSKPVVEYGYTQAIKIMPIDTGALKAGLQIINGKNSSKLRQNQPNHPKSGTSRPYHLWMAGLGKYNTSDLNFHGKDPQYMETVRILMENKSNDLISREIKKRNKTLFK